LSVDLYRLLNRIVRAAYLVHPNCVDVAQHAFRVYHVICGCRGSTNNTVKAGHRHGAVLLAVRAFVHPGVSMRPMDIIILLAPALD
jgi:hypothetical protein